MTVRRLSKTISTVEYIERFRDIGRFMQCCRECPNFGKSWACPPFEYDMPVTYAHYPKVTVYVSKIPVIGDQPLSRSHELMRPERLAMESYLLDREKQSGGRAFTFAGKCLHCPDGECSRAQGKPCSHPELVRPSLEAAGFDLGKTAAELFDLPLLWGKEGTLPPYLLLICALFHS